MNKVINLCVVGFGNAGQAFAKMLIQEHGNLSILTGYDVRITAIATNSKGCLLNKDGLNLNKVIESVEKYGDFQALSSDKISTIDLIKSSGAHVMIELSALSIDDGQPAISYIETAFSLDMHVITANKGPIAWCYRKLQNIANRKELKFLYETTVMDGTPIFNLVKYSLPGTKVLSFKGILNSTTNFIIEEMELGNTYEAAIKEAQRRGFAEADPSLDVDGWDAAAKTAALANVLMNGSLTPMTVDREGIKNLTPHDVKEALNAGKKIKLLCEGYIENGDVIGKVRPVLLDEKDIFSRVDATSSILSVTTNLMGEVIVVEKNPEIQQTAYGVYSDLITLLKL